MTHDEAVETPAWFRTAISHEATEHSVVVGGANVFYRRWGDPRHPPIVLVHGNRCHTHWWDHVAPLLADRHSVIALDLTGFGDSDRREQYGAAQWARDLQGVVDALREASDHPPLVVAHSRGGIVAATAAAEPGTSWRGLVAIDSSLGQPVLGYGGRGSTTPRGRVYPTADEARRRFRLVPPQPSSLPYVLDHIARHSIQEVEGGWGWKFDPHTHGSLGQGLCEATLSRVSCELAVLRAPDGRMVADAASQLHRLLGRTVPVVDVPHAHHHMMLDQPLAVVAALRTLLATWFPVNSVSRKSR